MAADDRRGRTATALINIDVDHLDRAGVFYMAALGLQVGRKFGGGAVGLTRATPPIYLLVRATGTGAGRATDERRRCERAMEGVRRWTG
jgi:hypothetical protein